MTITIKKFKACGFFEMTVIVAILVLLLQLGLLLLANHKSSLTSAIWTMTMACLAYTTEMSPYLNATFNSRVLMSSYILHMPHSLTTLLTATLVSTVAFGLNAASTNVSEPTTETCK